LLENHHKKLNMELNIAHYNVQKTWHVHQNVVQYKEWEIYNFYSTRALPIRAQTLTMLGGVTAWPSVIAGESFPLSVPS
jgi:hypothetical protein